MANTPFINAEGNYVVNVNVDLTIDPAMVGHNISRADLTDVLIEQMTRLDGVLRAVENFGA